MRQLLNCGSLSAFAARQSAATARRRLALSSGLTRGLKNPRPLLTLGLSGKPGESSGFICNPGKASLYSEKGELYLWHDSYSEQLDTRGGGWPTTRFEATRSFGLVPTRMAGLIGRTTRFDLTARSTAQ